MYLCVCVCVSFMVLVSQLSEWSLSVPLLHVMWDVSGLIYVNDANPVFATSFIIDTLSLPCVWGTFAYTQLLFK